VSANAKRTVCRLLGPEHVRPVRYLACGAAIHGTPARRRHVLNAARVAPAQAIAVGDEIWDSEAARAVHGRCAIRGRTTALRPSIRAHAHGAPAAADDPRGSPAW